MRRGAARCYKRAEERGCGLSVPRVLGESEMSSSFTLQFLPSITLDKQFGEFRFLSSMTFGFGRDTDEVNGFLPYVRSGDVAGSSDDFTDSPDSSRDLPLPPPRVSGSANRHRGAGCFSRPARTRVTTTISVTKQLEYDILAESRGLVRRNVPESAKTWVRAHKWRPDRQLPCLICKEYGHHPSNCLEGLRDRVAVAHEQCVKGKHFPYLHGVWRCQNCGDHLYDADVKEQHPAFYAREAEREWNKMKKYGSPCLSWQ